MDASSRLPSFNDFSPAIIVDMRECLRIVSDSRGNRAVSVALFRDTYFKGKRNKRSSTNLPASLGPRGLALVDLDTWQLTDLGVRVMEADTPEAAALVAMENVIRHGNGDKLLDAVRALQEREHRGGWKDGLKKELIRRGVTNLSRATTDHTTLANWMVEAGLLERKGRGYQVKDERIKRVFGVSTHERDELATLALPQQLALQRVRMAAEAEGAGVEIVSAQLIRGLLFDFPGLFPEDQFAGKVLRPLEKGGWITVVGRTGGRGSKSGRVKPTEKLLGIPATEIQPDFAVAVPPDLRARLQTPRSAIVTMLASEKPGERGLALELLVLRMLMDLSLEVRGFRQRGKDTAYAEIDLLAEGAALLFSRWCVQCKCHASARVGLSDVAKEVGIAIHQKAHVVCVVTTADFSTAAQRYAEQVARDTHLQFVLIPGRIVTRYLEEGRGALLTFVLQNARAVMTLKREQTEELERDA